MADCIFCKIAGGEIPVEFVYQDDKVVAFNDLNPQAPTHVLVIPRQHIERVSDASDDHDALLGRLILAANKIAAERGIVQPGYRLVFNCNEAAGQSVWHIHLHLLGGRDFTWPPG